MRLAYGEGPTHDDDPAARDLHATSHEVESRGSGFPCPVRFVEPFETIGRTWVTPGSAFGVLGLRKRFSRSAPGVTTPPLPPPIGSLAASPPSGNQGKL